MNMSKTKELKTKPLKRKPTGFDILYRVVTVVLAVAMYPIFYFADLLYIQMDHTKLADLWGSLTQNDNPTLNVTYERVAISEIPQWAETFSSLFGTNENPPGIWSFTHFRPAIIAAIILAVALILGIVIIALAIFTNKVKPILFVSLAGSVVTLISFVVFSSGFAAPIINGEVSLSELFNTDGIVINMILPYIGEITAITLSEAFWAVMFIMLGIFLWSLSILIVNMSDEKEKKSEKTAKK